MKAAKRKTKVKAKKAATKAKKSISTAATPELIAAKHDDREHAPLAMSSWEKYWECSKCLLLEPLVEDVPSFDKDFGTCVHEMIELYRRAKAVGKLPHIKDLSKAVKKLEDIGGTKENALEMYEHAETVSALLDKCKAKIERAGGTVDKELIETRVKITDNTWGTLDIAILYTTANGDKRIIAFDYKNGVYKSVQAEENVQLMNYCLAVRKTHSWDFKQATIIIYQPRVPGEEAVRQWVFTEKAANAYQEKLLRREPVLLKVLTTGKGARAKYGDHCLFCRGKVLCDVYKKDLETKALMHLDVLPPQKISKDKKGKDILMPDVSKIPDEQRFAIITHQNAIVKYINAHVAYETQLQQHGQGMDSLKMVPGRSSRAWREDISVGPKLVKLGVDNPYNQKLMGIGDIEVALCAKMEAAGTLKAKKEEAAKMISPLVTKTDPAPKLVPSDDPRDAIDYTDATEMLGELT